MAYGLTTQETRLLAALDTPRKVQDFLEAIPMPFGERPQRCRSPRQVLREGAAFCMEGAMLAATALRLQGRQPLVVDLESAPHDDDHVIAVFRERGHWGAVSKTNHAMLRWRDPIYRTIRELVLSYFHEYVDAAGRKTLRSYSNPVDLSRFDRRNWISSPDDVWFVPEHLADVRHLPLLTPRQRARLRPADPVERAAGNLETFPSKPRNR